MTLDSAEGSVTRRSAREAGDAEVAGDVERERIDAAHAVERADQNRPEGGVNHDRHAHRAAQS